MARFHCRCGKILSNTLAPNEVELKVYTDKEWDDIINLGQIDSVDLPKPKRDVWKCPVCERVYVFDEGLDSVAKVYALETE
jgi:hypothetical protein